MNRQQRRATLAKVRRDFDADRWESMREIPAGQWQHAAPPGVREAWRNNLYSAQVYHRRCEWGLMLLVTIRRHDGKPVRSWHDFQRIKNEVVGAGRIAFEVYPTQAELVDNCNVYHLWVIPEGFDFPVGLAEQLPG